MSQDVALELHKAELEVERSLALPHKANATLREKYKWCITCGSPQNLESHHIVFRSQGGTDYLGNLALLCSDCHDRAHGITVAGGPLDDFQPFVLKREGDDLFLLTENGEARIIDEKPHEPTEIEAEAAHTLHRVIIELKASSEAIFWDIGNALTLLRDSHGYRVLGCQTLNEYLGSPEVAISRGHAYKLMGIVDHAKRLELDESRLRDIDKDKLAIIMPGAKQDNIEQRLHDAAELSRSDVLALYGSREPTAQTSHEHRCLKCNAVNRYEGN